MQLAMTCDVLENAAAALPDGDSEELPPVIRAALRAAVDRAYGALAAYVAGHALQVDGPIREYYLVGRQDTTDESTWRTEVCWPTFNTGAAA